MELIFKYGFLVGFFFLFNGLFSEVLYHGKHMATPVAGLVYIFIIGLSILTKICLRMMKENK